MKLKFPTAKAAKAIATVVLLTSASRVLAADYDNPPINYSTAAPHDPAAKLKLDIESGKTQLTRTPERGYLDSLLKALNISPSSQTLVFSQTSFQRSLINPQNPRALYFNDETYVGFVPGGTDIEIASTDANLGIVFYTIDQNTKPQLARQAAAERSGTPRSAAAGSLSEAHPLLLHQTENCLACHGQSMTRDIPGLLIRSVYPDSNGQPILSAGTFITTPDSPFQERWGGWYVTGSLGNQKHMGNTLWQDQGERDPKPLPAPAELKDLSAQIDTTNYLTPYSDAVALMVLEHQTETHNCITKANYGTRLALRDEKVIADAMGEKIDPHHHSESTVSRIKSSCEPLVQALLFANEVPLTSPIQGSSKFTKEFPTQSPRDSKNRSLRDFDLKTRLFQYPCSYLIYAPSFEGLPQAAKDQIYKRLHEILTGKDKSKTYSHLTPDDRANVTQILQETNRELHEAWRTNP